VTDLIIRFVVLFVGLALAAFVIARMTQGIIRWVILAAVGVLAAIAISMGLRQFVGYIPGIGNRSNPNVPVQPSATPTVVTVPSPSPLSTATPSASPTPSPQATSDQQDVETGFNQLPVFAQPFDTQGSRTANGQRNNSTNNGGNGNSTGTSNRPQTSTPSRPIPAGW
jgi:hypothetical protein